MVDEALGISSSGTGKYAGEPKEVKQESEKELSAKLQAIAFQKRDSFLKEVEAASQRHGWTFAAVPQFTQDGRITAQIAVVPRQQQSG